MRSQSRFPDAGRPLAYPLRFNRNVEQIVKPQDRLQQNQHDKRHQVANGQEFTHHRPPYTDHALPGVDHIVLQIGREFRTPGKTGQ